MTGYNNTGNVNASETFSSTKCSRHLYLLTCGVDADAVVQFLGDDDFRMGKSYVLFLHRDHTGFDLVNVSGSAFPVSAYRKGSLSRDGDVRGYIALLLNDLVSEHKERAALIEQQVSEYLSLP